MPQASIPANNCAVGFAKIVITPIAKHKIKMFDLKSLFVVYFFLFFTDKLISIEA